MILMKTGSYISNCDERWSREIENFTYRYVRHEYGESDDFLEYETMIAPTVDLEPIAQCGMYEMSIIWQVTSNPLYTQIFRFR